MFRFSYIVFLVVPSILPAEEKPKKPSYIGVQIARGAEEDEITVRLVLDNSPAEKAGLKSGDRILRINGVKPANLAATVKIIRLLEPKKKAKLLIERDGKEKTIEITPITLE